MPGMPPSSSHQHNSACNGAYEQQLPVAMQSAPSPAASIFIRIPSSDRPTDLIIIYYRLNVSPKVFSLFCGFATLTCADNGADSPAAH